MARRPVLGDHWSESALERVNRMGKEVLLRAARKTVWPTTGELSVCPVTEPVTLDEAFTMTMYSLSMVSNRCQRYYKTCGHQGQDKDDQLHCKRFHSCSNSARRLIKNPVHSEKVQVIIQPGNYAVTAKKWDSNITETHVNVAGGGTANLDFKL